MANRDLAIVYSYSGQLEKAEEFAREALKHEARDPKLVVGPAHKVIGDVQTRRGDYAGAVASYETALANSSRALRAAGAVLAGQCADRIGRYARARAQLLGTLPPPQEAPLAAQLERTRARLLLAENKPAEARDLYRSSPRAPSAPTAATTGSGPGTAWRAASSRSARSRPRPMR